ncbi:MAG: carbohydrate ABC transporter substrate-binding protein, partial [Burkholderiales bacterium]|nr:carbohydrate ABC transporter substrate-binding protein [Opitutaceae bacterium]
ARRGRVLAPLIHTDAIHVFYMLCHALGETPFASASPSTPDALFISRATGLAALELGRELAAALPPACLAMNPIAVLEALARTDDAWYCPFAFGYSNYARPRYAPHLVTSGEPVLWTSGAPLVTTLGGTGIAITQRCAHPEIAAKFAAFLASPDIQAGLYFDAGGQPAHRAAWLDERVNQNSHDYFRRTLPALDRAWLRPRYAGYLHFQDHGAYVIADAFKGTLTAATALDRLEALHRESRQLSPLPSASLSHP